MIVSMLTMLLATQPIVQIDVEGEQKTFTRKDTIHVVLRNASAEALTGHLSIEAFVQESWQEVTPDICGRFGSKAVCMQNLQGQEKKSIAYSPKHYLDFLGQSPKPKSFDRIRFRYTSGNIAVVSREFQIK